ncbi:MAG: AbrB/MazE/SpoVT family DNA-binding domain-containing protein [Candidatus Hydrothermarchaeota archaeon]|nr:AbrB/MazE/SpoVT family DNA-binding domain-containing protein [Candidatus Hydrothermarchaeota archaeon]
MIKCGKCGKEMKETALDKYEFEEGISLDNVRAMKCPTGHVTFTEEQALAIERRTEDIKKHAFKFVRSISRSGRSLVMRIPADLAKHVGLKEDSKIELIPLDKKKFLVEVK